MMASLWMLMSIVVLALCPGRVSEAGVLMGAALVSAVLSLRDEE